MEKLKYKIYCLFKKGEKYLSLDIIYLSKGGFWITIGQISASIAAFLLSVAYANFLTPETYGTYKYVVSVAGILSIFTLSGMGGAITQAVVKRQEGTIYPALKTRIKFGLIGAIFSIIIALYYLINSNYLLSGCFFVVAIFIPWMDSLNLYESLFYGKKQFKTASLFMIMNQVFSAIFLILTAFLTRNTFAIVLAYFFSWTSIRALSFVFAHYYYKPNDQVEKSFIRFGKDLSLVNALGTFADYLDKILIFQLLGSLPLATYTIATAPVEQVKSLAIRNISRLSLPKYSLKKRKELKSHVFLWTIRLLVLVFLLILAYVATIPYLFPIFFPRYIKAIALSQLFSTTLVSIVFYLPYTALNAQLAKKELYWQKIISSIIQIALVVSLVYLYGIWGIVWARIISSIANVLIALILLKKL